jgi:predicted membrane-bound dolichyl-phosphate-mannose-protein mannosyltransferase
MVEFLSIMWIIIALLDLVLSFFTYLTMMLSSVYATMPTCQVGGSSMAHPAPT